MLTNQARIVGGISCASWINSIVTDTCASSIGKDGCLTSQIDLNLEVETNIDGDDIRHSKEGR
jgi:hypothetical protein